MNRSVALFLSVCLSAQAAVVDWKSFSRSLALPSDQVHFAFSQEVFAPRAALFPEFAGAAHTVSVIQTLSPRQWFAMVRDATDSTDATNLRPHEKRRMTDLENLAPRRGAFRISSSTFDPVYGKRFTHNTFSKWLAGLILDKGSDELRRLVSRKDKQFIPGVRITLNDKSLPRKFTLLPMDEVVINYARSIESVTSASEPIGPEKAIAEAQLLIWEAGIKSYSVSRERFLTQFFTPEWMPLYADLIRGMIENPANTSFQSDVTTIRHRGLSDMRLLMSVDAAPLPEFAHTHVAKLIYSVYISLGATQGPTHDLAFYVLCRVVGSAWKLPHELKTDVESLIRKTNSFEVSAENKKILERTKKVLSRAISLAKPVQVESFGPREKWLAMAEVQRFLHLAIARSEYRLRAEKQFMDPRYAPLYTEILRDLLENPDGKLYQLHRPAARVMALDMMLRLAKTSRSRIHDLVRREFALLLRSLWSVRNESDSSIRAALVKTISHAVLSPWRLPVDLAETLEEFIRTTRMRDVPAEARSELLAARASLGLGEGADALPPDLPPDRKRRGLEAFWDKTGFWGPTNHRPHHRRFRTGHSESRLRQSA